MRKLLLLTVPVLILFGLSIPVGVQGSPPSGEALWNAHCNRCHSPRMAQERTDKEWEVILMHMQVRAGLTKAEAKAIVEYLKTLNG